MFNEPTFDFYDKTMLKTYNLNEKMRYQLECLDKLDVFTRLHCENVASLVVRICEYMHLNSAFTEYCTVCAYLHDLGKLFIPPSILQKPGKLTDEEYDVMKTHTTIGYKMCLKDEQLRPYKAGPIYHHEALNGSGYPMGLKGKDIPLEGQIIRVADEFDAISSKRQYKSHIGICDTLKILIENSMPSNGSKQGKNNPKIVKYLFKVVIDDTEYEISNISVYLKKIKDSLNRFELMEKYKKKMDSANSDKTYQYYKSGIQELLMGAETLENFQDIHKDYLNTYEKNCQRIDNLQKEIKELKKLKHSF